MWLGHADPASPLRPTSTCSTTAVGDAVFFDDVLAIVETGGADCPNPEDVVAEAGAEAVRRAAAVPAAGVVTAAKAPRLGAGEEAKSAESRLLGVGYGPAMNSHRPRGRGQEGLKALAQALKASDQV